MIDKDGRYLVLNPKIYRKRDNSFVMRNILYNTDRFIKDIEKLAESMRFCIPFTVIIEKFE